MTRPHRTARQARVRPEPRSSGSHRDRHPDQHRTRWRRPVTRVGDRTARRHRRASPSSAGGVLPDGDRGLRDVGHAHAAARQRRARRARPHRRQPRRRRRRAGARHRRLVGRADRPGRPLDTDHWFVVASNVLGGCQGTTGPSTPAPDGRPWGSRFPFVTVRDQVAAEAALADALGIASLGLRARRLDGRHAGARVGGRPTPTASRSAIVLASTPYATADQIAWCQPQLLAIRRTRTSTAATTTTTPTGPTTGWASRAGSPTSPTARARARHTGSAGRPRSARTRSAAGGRYAVESYLDHHADKLARRFDANSYVVLTEAMNSHDVGRGRGGLAAALARVTAELVVVAVDSDRLYPPRLSEEIAAAAGSPGGVRQIASRLRPRRLPHRDRPGRRVIVRERWTRSAPPERGLGPPSGSVARTGPCPAGSR